MVPKRWEPFICFISLFSIDLSSIFALSISETTPLFGAAKKWVEGKTKNRERDEQQSTH